MIGKLKKGASFGGCVRYVTGKDEAKILAPMECYSARMPR